MKPTLPLFFLAFAAISMGTMPLAAAQKERGLGEEQATPATPPEAEEKPAPYDDRILRLAEILGSVHYLRNLCGAPDPEWRQMMQSLIAEETRNEPKRAAMFTAGFNRGYRSFAATYTKCTPQARAADEKYRAEGATLATEITARFGN